MTMIKYQVWYMRPEFFADGIMGILPNARDLSSTHVFLTNVMSDGGLDHVYHAMQGEVWSPDGEARALIQSKGLRTGR